MLRKLADIVTMTVVFVVARIITRFQAAMESLVSGAVCGISYHLFSGQPLTIVGSTGPVLVFETIVFKFCSLVQ